MFNKRFGLIALLLCIVLTVGYFVIPAEAVSTVLLAVEGPITDANLVKFKGINGIGEDTGLAATNVVKCKFDATLAPTVNNDIDEGYTVGSRWLDVTNDKSYVCLDNTDGAAVWHLDVVGPGASTDHAIVRWNSTGGRTTLNSVVTVSDAGVIAGGEWQGTVVSPVYGGTGIANNVASTITITGSYAMTLTITGATGITLPESGTLCVTTGTPETTFQIDDDNTGPKLKNSAGEMQIRNAADDAYANLRALSFYGDGSNLTGVGAAAASALTISAKAAENITKGQVVYISGATGQTPEVSLADNTDSTKHAFVGVAAETKTTGQVILIRVKGELTGLATNGFLDGDILYLSTAGALTKTLPTSGGVGIVGYCSYSHASAGKIVLVYHSPHSLYVPSTDNIILRMGDNAGTNKVEFRDYANNALGTINSDGRWAFGSLGSELAVAATTYGAVWFYFGDNADVTALRSRAVLKTTDAPTKTAQGAVLQASNADNINAFVLQGALIEAIGKSDANASTITHMRGALINTEWNAFDTVTNLKTLYVRTHTRNSAGNGSISGTGYLIYLENEAVGGDGQQLDAGIFLKSTNVSTPHGFDYGIDLSGAVGEIATADIRLSNSETIDNITDGAITFGADRIIVPEVKAPGAAGLKLYDDGGKGLYIEDTGKVHFNNNVFAYGASAGEYKELQFEASSTNMSTILRIKPTGTPTLDDHGMTNVGAGLRIDGETDGSPRVFIGVEDGGDFVISTYGDAGIRFMPNEATRMHIDKDGNIKMGDGIWTNYVHITAAGVLSLEGTASITGYATTELDNLGTVAINTSLLSDATDTDDLGSATKEWRSLYIGTVGKIYLGLDQEIALECAAANTLDITATAGIIVDALVVDGATAKGIEITGANATAQIYVGGADILATGEQAIYVNCPSETNATNAMWLTLGSTVVTGDVTGARIKVTTNAETGGGADTGQNVRAVYAQAIAAANDDAGLLQGGLFVADVSAGSCVVYNVHVLAGHYSSGASTVIGGDLYVGYLRSQTRSTNSRAVTGLDVLLCLENEAIEGVGMQIDAAIYIKATNVTTPKAFDYIIDMSGASGEVNTADIRLSYGETISNTTDGYVAISGMLTATSPLFTNNVRIETVVDAQGILQFFEIGNLRAAIMHRAASDRLDILTYQTNSDIYLHAIRNVVINKSAGADPTLIFAENGTTKWQIYNDHNDDALQIKAGATLVMEIVTGGYLSLPVGSLTLLATTSSTTGIIFKGADRFIHNYGHTDNTGQNTFLGIRAGNFTMTSGTPTEASFNTGVGQSTLSVLTTGYANTTVGQEALFSCIVGYQNVAMGDTSLRAATGYGNTAVGSRSGRTITTGNDNTFVGYYSGHHASQKADAGNSMALGANTYTTASNQIVIGDINIVETILRGNIGIGTTSFSANAAGTLQIANGTAPTAHLDNTINIYSVDSSDATATLGLFLEQAVEAVDGFTETHKFKILINGTEYWIALDPV